MKLNSLIKRQLSHGIKKAKYLEVSVGAQLLKNLTRIHEDVGSIPGLAQGIKGSDVAMNYGVHRLQTCLRSGIAVMVA